MTLQPVPTTSCEDVQMNSRSANENVADKILKAPFKLFFIIASQMYVILFDKWEVDFCLQTDGRTW
jgi:hypothetical protein